jgi:hypothetical protein
MARQVLMVLEVMLEKLERRVLLVPPGKKVLLVTLALQALLVLLVRQARQGEMAHLACLACLVREVL